MHHSGSNTYPIIERPHPMNRCSNKRRTGALANRFFDRPDTIRFSFRGQRNQAKPLGVCRNKGKVSGNAFSIFYVWIVYAVLRCHQCTHLIEKTTAQHVEWTFSSLVKVEGDLCIDTHTEVIVHVQFAVGQPSVDHAIGMVFDINQPTIQHHDIRFLNLQKKYKQNESIERFILRS